VATALVAITFPGADATNTTASAGKQTPSSNPSLQQRGSLAAPWHQISMMLLGITPIFTQVRQPYLEALNAWSVSPLCWHAHWEACAW
jgi:hypothetical protein